jgi:hypothetical protein
VASGLDDARGDAHPLSCKPMTLLHDCPWFEMSLSNQGEKGFSVMPVRTELGHRRWYLVARPVDRDDAGDLSKRSAGLPAISVAIAMSLPLRFCPSCGTDLAEMIAADERAFDVLAAAARARFPTGI